MKKLGLLLMLFVSLSGFGQLARPTVYIEPQNGFETYLAAAIAKKNVPGCARGARTSRSRGQPR